MKIFTCTLLAVLISVSAWAGTDATTISGRILKTDGTPLVSASVPFVLSITDPGGTCLIFQESMTVNMSNSRGDFEIQMGTGTRTTPASGTFPVSAAFDNSGALACGAGGTYTPAMGDNRLVKIQFMDGAGWKTFTPSLVLNSAPRAFFANSADKLGSNIAADFLLKAGLPTCGAGDFLTYNGSALSCATASGGGGSLTGDVSGTLSATSVDKIKGVALDMTGNSTGKVLTYNGSAWAPATPAAGGVTSVTAGTGLTGGTITTSGTIGLGTELSGLNSLASTGFMKRTGSGTYAAGAVSLASDVSGTLPVGNGGTGATSFANYSVIASNGSGNQVAVPGSIGNTMLQWTAVGPAWSSASYPASTSANQLLYSSSSNVVGGLSTMANATLKTDGSGVPAWVSAADAYTQYALLAGRTGGQTLKGGTSAFEKLTLESTSNPTKGTVLISPNGGTVGIGTPTPDTTVALNVYGNIKADGYFSSTSSGYGLYQNANAITLTTYLGANYAQIGTESSHKLAFVVNNADRMTLLPNGNVGIGTTNPGSLLENVETRTDMSGSWYTQANRQTVTPVGSSSGLFTATYNYSKKTGSQDAMQINGSYNRAENASAGGTLTDLIGAKNLAITSTLTTNSYGTLSQSNVTNGNITNSYGAYNDSTRSGSSGSTNTAYGSYNRVINSVAGATTTNGIGTYTEVKNSSGTMTNGYGLYIGNVEATSKWSLYANDATAPVYLAGDVGIGTTTPAYKLHVMGDINASGQVRASGVALTSDIRFKREIQTLNNSLEKISNLRGVTYKWRQDEFPDRQFNDRQQIGLIAQEVEKEFPDLVLTDKTGYKSVNYPAFVAPIIEAVKELGRRVGLLMEASDKNARDVASVNDRTVQLEIENEKIRIQTEQLRQENLDLKARLEKIEARLNSK